MAILDVATTVENVRTVLSNIAWWQTITGTSTAADAAKHIHRFAADDEDLSRTPFMILNVEDTPLEAGPSNFEMLLTIECTLVLEIPSDQRENVSTMAVWFWQQLSALLAGIGANYKTSGAVMWRSVSMAAQPGPVEDDDNEGLCEWLTTLALQVYVE